ncbi:MAG TPA: inositol monophosphatase family protein [archaeon]|nr:inositol monophosphatase family protein [archaeon]
MESAILRKAHSLAVSLAREAGVMLLENLGKGLGVELKGEINPVTELDRRVEEFLVSRIAREFPGHDFLAEEQTTPEGDSEFCWIIDPLDGTTNYARGYPCFSISIALEQQGQALLGVIYQPATAEMFTVTKGGGAFLNERQIKVSKKTQALEQSFLITGFPYTLREPGVLERNLSRFRKFLARSFAIRRDGSAAYDLACLAAGRFDGFWEEGLSCWDTVAGALMVREAGGVVSDFGGESFNPQTSKTILAAGSSHLHKKMLALLRD